MAIETVSFRHLLVEALERFLASHGAGEVAHADIFAEAVVSLANHREEGTSLYPVLFICKDIASITEVLGGKDPVLIGEGSMSRVTIHQALKHCAPLAERRQWAIFISLGTSPGEKVRYGVFRTEISPLSPTTFGSLRALARPDLFLLGLLQIGEHSIEVRAASGYGLHLHLSGARSGAREPYQVIQAFIQSVSQHAAPDLVQPLRDFYYRVFTELSRDVHGALIVVLPKTGARMDIFTDAVLLEEPLSIPDAIRAYLRHPGIDNISRLYSLASLIRGMLGSDGITLFRSDGVVLGYNAFIQTSHASRPALGGARRRAFHALAGHVGHGLNLAMYRSQDGAMDFFSIPHADIPTPSQIP